jgi:HSP20 family protein
MAKRINKNDKTTGETEFGLGGIFKGLGDLVEKLNELSQSGKELSQTKEFGDGKQVKGIYGFTVKMGIGGQEPRVEPFGNIRRDVHSGNTVVQEVREPVVDIFEEENHILLVAEMPGVCVEDVKIELLEDLLTICAERGEKKYRKEVLLPGVFSKEKMQVSGNNGVLEIKFPR